MAAELILWLGLRRRSCRSCRSSSPSTGSTSRPSAIVIAAWPAARLIGEPVFGWLADRTAPRAAHGRRPPAERRVRGRAALRDRRRAVHRAAGAGRARGRPCTTRRPAATSWTRRRPTGAARPSGCTAPRRWGVPAGPGARGACGGRSRAAANRCSSSAGSASSSRPSWWPSPSRAAARGRDCAHAAGRPHRAPARAAGGPRPARPRRAPSADAGPGPAAPVTSLWNRTLIGAIVLNFGGILRGRHVGGHLEPVHAGQGASIEFIGFTFVAVRAAGAARVAVRRAASWIAADPSRSSSLGTLDGGRTGLALHGRGGSLVHRRDRDRGGARLGARQPGALRDRRRWAARPADRPRRRACSGRPERSAYIVSSVMAGTALRDGPPLPVLPAVVGRVS